MRFNCISISLEFPVPDPLLECFPPSAKATLERVEMWLGFSESSKIEPKDTIRLVTQPAHIFRAESMIALGKLEDIEALEVEEFTVRHWTQLEESRKVTRLRDVLRPSFFPLVHANVNDQIRIVLRNPTDRLIFIALKLVGTAAVPASPSPSPTTSRPPSREKA